MIGQQLSIFEYQAFLNWKWKINAFPGRRGTVLVLADDMTITRQECLDFAVKFMEGNLIEISIDLKTLERTQQRINPPPDY
jgi:hypothetical protein